MARNEDTPPNFPFARQITVAGNITKEPYHNGKGGRSAFASVSIALNSRYEGFTVPMFVDAQLFGGHADFADTLKVGQRVFATGDLSAKIFPLKNTEADGTPEDYDENPDDYGISRILTNVSAFGREERWFDGGSDDEGSGRRRGRRSDNDGGDDGNETRTRRSRSKSDDDEKEEADTTSRRRRSRRSSDDESESNDSAESESNEESSSGGRRRRRSRVKDEGDE